MKIYVSSNNSVISQYPKQLIIYYNNEIIKPLELVDKNVVDIDKDYYGKVKLVCRCYCKKLMRDKKLLLVIVGW